MKRVGLLLAILMLWTGVCFAEEQWEYVGDTKTQKVYISNEIAYRPTERNDIYRAKVKTESDSLNYSITTILINKDNEVVSFIVTNKYRDGVKYDSFTYNGSWSDKNIDSWGFAVDKIIDKINKK